MIRSVFITGSNSGIGKEMALHYARQGAFVGLAARRGDLLEETKKECIEAGGKAEVFQLDVNDKEALQEAAKRFIEISGSIDLVVANAGASAGDRLTSGDSSSINFLLNTNIIGVTNTIYPFIPHMKDNGGGKIAIVGSMASSRGLPGKGGYSASKRALRVLGESWRMSLKRYGINITVFSPGFIDTPFVKRNKYPMPFMISAKEAAAIMVKAIDKGKGHHIFPWQMRFLYPIIAILPESLIGMVVNRDKYEIDRSKGSVN